MLKAYRHYAPDPSLKWWTPPPGERPAFTRLARPILRPIRHGFNAIPTSPSLDDATDAALYSIYAIDYVALETELALASAWNEPHFCLHEGPWTRGSCATCDVREAKTVVALIAWLTGQDDMLKRLHSPWVQCLHPGASRYEPCRRCRIDFYYAYPERWPHDAVL